MTQYCELSSANHRGLPLVLLAFGRTVRGRVHLDRTTIVSRTSLRDVG
jgi:hypothetical protein